MEVSGIKPEKLPYTEFGELNFKDLVNNSVIKRNPPATKTNQIIELGEAFIQEGGMVVSNPPSRELLRTKLLAHSLQKIIPPTNSNTNNWIVDFLIAYQ